MRWIIRNSLRFRYLVVAGAIALMVFGVSATQKMPVPAIGRLSGSIPPSAQTARIADSRVWSEPL